MLLHSLKYVPLRQEGDARLKIPQTYNVSIGAEPFHVKINCYSYTKVILIRNTVIKI